MYIFSLPLPVLKPRTGFLKDLGAMAVKSIVKEEGAAVSQPRWKGAAYLW